MNLIFDIETVGYDLDELSESQQEYLLRYAEKEKDEIQKEEKRDEAIRYLSLYPWTAKIVSIGFLNTDTEKSLILYEGEAEEEIEEFVPEEKNVIYKAMPEQEMISSFWKYVSAAETVISFNGRNFDIPFVMIRSAINKMKPPKNLIKNRYNCREHIDLLEQFTFYGMNRKFNMDFYCNALQIESPKSKGISGMEVKELYNAGRIKDIAVYCGEDVRATFELYKFWNEFLNIS